VHRHILSKHPTFSDLGYFLPIFFDGFLATGEAPKSVPTCAEPILKLGVFGSIEANRRNYWGLLNALRDMDRAGAVHGFHLYLVGKAPQAVHEFIVTNRLDHIVEHGTEFISFRRMFALLADMDIVLFLVDRETANIALYNCYKITGTSSLVKAFRKVGATSSDFKIDESLADKCFVYSGTEIQSLLHQISDGKISATEVEAKRRRYESDALFSFAVQQAHLVSFLEKVMAK
jgi:hypothetical protein